MRRDPLAIVSVVGAFYIFYALRGLGRALAAAILGQPVDLVMLYKVLPTFDVFSGAWEMATPRLVTLILAGPACVLAVGYLLMVIVSRKGARLPSQLVFFLCVTSYAGLMLDPIYYAVIPLLRLGGEPETLAWVLDVSRFWVALPAMVLLGINVVLTKAKLVPLIKTNRGL
jgi:hypothetical protein